MLGGGFVLPADCAGAVEVPVPQRRLSGFPRAVGRRGGVPEGDFAVGGHVPRGADDDHVADEAAARVGVAAVVDVGCFDEDAGVAVSLFVMRVLLLLRRTLGA